MNTKVIAAVAALLALGLTSSTGFAQQGMPDDPMSDQNTIPSPNSDVPNDPAANDNPAARDPTSPSGTGQYELKKEGYGKGTSGKDYNQQDQDNQ